MGILQSQTWQEDLALAAKSLAGRDLPPGRCLVTGATGLIGSAFVDLLRHLRRTRHADLQVVAAGRDRARLAARFGSEVDGLSFLTYDATRPFTCPGPTDWFVHAAGNASPDLYMSDPCGTIAANVDGLHGILEAARRQRASRVLYVSSSEVYGTKVQPGPFREDVYGSVDPLNPRACYAEAKRMAETLCAAYANQHGVPVSIVRPGHIYGPTATTSDRRVSSGFAFTAARGEPLVLKSAGAQTRSYCHCLDCATAMLVVLLSGESGRAYNISNPRSVISIRRMAEAFAQAAGVPVTFGEASAAEKDAFNPMNDSSLDATRLLGLGWHPVFDVDRGFVRTLHALQEADAHARAR